VPQKQKKSCTRSEMQLPFLKNVTLQVHETTRLFQALSMKAWPVFYDPGCLMV
jgi:hypothetical protein